MSNASQITFLQRYFPTGSAHVLGPLTSDHWVVFVADFCERPPQESTDVTLDIKMFDICDGMSRLLHGDKAEKDAATAGVVLQPKVAAAAAAAAIGTGTITAEEDEQKDAAAASGGADAEKKEEEADDDDDDAGSELESTGGATPSADPVDLSMLPPCDGPSLSVAKFVTQRSGMAALLPGSTVHAFMFEPCGYSANGLLDGSYWTVHVTPEKHCSYASFETNVRVSSLRPLVRAVLALFRPRRFTLTLFADAQGVKEMKDLPVQPYIDCSPALEEEREK